MLNHPFSHPGDPNHIEHLATYWAQVFGGPERYSRGHSFVLGLHAGTGAEHDLGARFVECFVRAADDAELPDDPDFRKALREYMQWAVAEVMAVSPPGSVVRDDQPVPRWSWEGLVTLPD